MAVGAVTAGVGKPKVSHREGRGGTASVVTWSPKGEIDIRDWLRAGQRLGTMTRCGQWWIGDWVRYGNGRWGEKYKEASRITAYDVQSLRNMAYVAGRFEVSRRRYKLTWSHHAEVSSLDREDQDRWLELAEAERMTVADLRIELRAVRRAESNEPAPRSRDAVSAQNVTCPHCSHEFTLSPGATHD
jgi:hypothetical protein